MATAQPLEMNQAMHVDKSETDNSEVETDPATTTDTDNTTAAATGRADCGKKLELGGMTAVTTMIDRKTTWLENVRATAPITDVEEEFHPEQNSNNEDRPRREHLGSERLGSGSGEEDPVQTAGGSASKNNVLKYAKFY